MKYWITIILALGLATAHAASSVYKATVKQDFETVYKQVYTALEDHRFFVVLEPDIGKNLSRFAQRWGEDYNRNKLERIRSMVFCHAWYANQVSNADPDMAGLCPLHVSLIHKDGITTVLFVRPDYVAQGTAAEKVAAELTRSVIEALEEGIRKAGK